MELYISSYKLGRKTDFIEKWINENDCKEILLITNAKDINVKDNIEENKILDDIYA